MASEGVASTSTDLRSPHFSEKHGIEFCIHECPVTLYSTFKMIFRDLAPMLPNRSELASNDHNFALQVIAVWQPTKNDMSGFSDEVQDERDAKTAKFIDWAKQVTSDLKQKSSCKFVDFVDPSSGLPYTCPRGGTIFIETDDAVLNLGYQILDFGCCKAVCHPKWGTKSFLSIIITDASPEEVHQVLSANLAD